MDVSELQLILKQLKGLGASTPMQLEIWLQFYSQPSISVCRTEPLTDGTDAVFR